MKEIVAEAIEEATGSSSKRWALLLLAFVAGVAVTVWVTKRIRSRQAGPDDPVHLQATGSG